MTDIELINLVKQANVAAASGAREQAIQMFREVVRRDPDHVSAWMQLATLVEDPEEKRACLQRVLTLNPYHEDARAMLATLEGEETEASEVAKDEEVEVFTCFYHPDRTTTLRCNKCGRPICPDCAIRTPVGYRCPDCVREQQDKFYTATATDVLIGAAVAWGSGLIAGVVLWLLILILGGLGFFGFLAAFFLGPAVGGATAELALRAMGKRRARRFPWIGTAALVVGMLMVAGVTGALFMGLLTSGLFLVLAASTFYARIKF